MKGVLLIFTLKFIAMIRQLAIILTFVLLSARISNAQYEADSVFTWKYAASADLSAQAVISFLPNSGVTVVSWAFGNGIVSSERAPVLTFPYTSSADEVGVTLNYAINSESKVCTRKVSLSPAFFLVQNDGNSKNFERIFASAFDIDNSSKNIRDIRFAWEIDGISLKGHNSSNTDLGLCANVRHIFTTGGKHDVKLCVYDINAKSNAAVFSRTIDLSSLQELQKLQNIPNVFTPNHDGVNDFFEIPSSGTSWFVLKVYSRSGALLYKGEASIIQWDGRNNQGVLLPNGIYYYIIDDTNKVYESTTGFVYIFGD